MWEFLGSVFSKLIDWIMSLHIRPTIKVTGFDIEKTDDKKLDIKFSAFISNNTSKAFSVSQKVLVFYKGKEEVAKIDVTRYEIRKKKDVFDEFNVLTPIDDVITLQPGEMKEIKIFGHKIDVDTVGKVFFSCFTGRKTYTFRIKVPKTDVVEDISEIEEITETEKKIIKHKIKEWIKYLNSNIGAVTWISTVAIAVIATWLKFMWYVFQRGKLFYWNIDSTAISIIDDITLYSIFLMFVFGVLIIGVMLIPLIIVKSKMKVWWKIIDFIVLFLAFSAIVFNVTGMYSLIEQNGSAGIVASAIVLIIAFMCFFSPSLSVGMLITPSKKTEKGAKRTSIQGVIFCGVLWMIIMTGYIGYVGYDSAKKQTDFRMTSDGYAIIYETNDYYYLAEYDKENRCVIKGHQIIVKKENIEYFYSVK